jgi:ABC-type transport system involved in cytochrome bd biosynthesis fused ATPase/permease subunit
LPQKFLLYDEVAAATRFTAKDLKTTDLIFDKSKPLENEYKTEMAKIGAVEVNAYAEENSTGIGDTPDKNGIRVTNVTAKWTDDLPENTLTDVSLEVRPGRLVAVIGPVGSGKVCHICKKYKFPWHIINFFY